VRNILIPLAPAKPLTFFAAKLSSGAYIFGKYSYPVENQIAELVGEESVAHLFGEYAS
jgi:hypothetical protein